MVTLASLVGRRPLLILFVRRQILVPVIVVVVAVDVTRPRGEITLPTRVLAVVFLAAPTSVLGMVSSAVATATRATYIVASSLRRRLR